MRRLASALEAASKTRARLGKIDALASALAGGGATDEELAVATRLLAGRTLPVRDPRPLGVGYSLVFETALRATGEDPEILRACARKTGDLGEAFGLLVARDEGEGRQPGLSLRDVARLFDALAGAGGRGDKLLLLEKAFASASFLETKYLAKVLLGELRVGVQEGVLEEAVARAFDVPLEALRRATALMTDLGDVAVLARAGRIGEAEIEAGRPLAFMLASPLETLKTPLDPARTVVEDKIDGMRAQIHAQQGSQAGVAIFARGLDNVTVAFPEVAAALRGVPGSILLDGELLVLGLGENGRPRPFQALQPRLRKTAPTRELLASAPVAFVAYDLLFWDEPLLRLPWYARRERLERLAAALGRRPGLVLHDYRPLRAEVPLESQLDVEFEAARARGHEGLVLKAIDSPYDAGRRGQAWLKVKRAFATLDVVVTAAEAGHGRRAGVLSDYTFAVWRGEELVNVGKAFSGLTDPEIEAMTARLQALTVERHGGVRVVRPEIVLEVGFDGIQRSKRHKSGFALRFPRILRIRDDKAAAAADRIEAVEALFQAQLASGHREEDAAPPEPAPKGALKKAATRQLRLFDDE